MTELTTGIVYHLPINQLAPDPDQPRKTFTPASIKTLAASIKGRGMLQPIQARLCGDALLIHDGERRWRAAKSTGVETVPVLIVAPEADGLRLEQYAVNNLREPLKPMEIARLLADLRKDHTTNEIAALLARDGLPAMKTKDINAAARLVELPDWAQAMIDARQLDAGAAAPLFTAMPWPDVLAAVKKTLSESIKWRGQVTSGEVKNTVARQFQAIGVNLDATGSYYDNPVHFNAKTVCKKCEFYVRIDGRQACMNKEAFATRNAEAKAAGLLPGGKKPDKAASAAGTSPVEEDRKAKQRANTVENKTREYLHSYLVQKLMDEMPSQLDLQLVLIIWGGLDRPGQFLYEPRPKLDDDHLSIKSKTPSIETMLNASNWSEDRLEAARHIARHLHWRETLAIWHHFNGDEIDAVWTINEGFTNLFRKAELIHMAKAHGLSLPAGRKEWDKCKASEIKTAFLMQADKITKPEILQAMYADLEPARQSYGYPDDIEDEEPWDDELEDEEAE